ncbi:hypothetical protein QJS10_CPB15g00923 [Acorus calamus]|uniref:Uncharacterized protein n=1 Tax=Acorus calamus TaxID=4465 RepID=A0AAV9D5X2_ACOCL|nr:hypothetical protein QJS10_CPB15g00923 [Acorus calamus]
MEDSDPGSIRNRETKGAKTILEQLQAFPTPPSLRDTRRTGEEECTLVDEKDKIRSHTNLCALWGHCNGEPTNMDAALTVESLDSLSGFAQFFIKPLMSPDAIL